MDGILARLVFVLMLSFGRCMHYHVIQHLGGYPCGESSGTLLARPMGRNEVGFKEKAYSP
jgi:hypothetical protein